MQKSRKTGEPRGGSAGPVTVPEGVTRVFLAEKRSIAQALADVLPGRKVQRNGCIVCGTVCVTWLSGHLLEQAPPEAYDPALKKWTRETLPIVPEKFRTLVRKDRGVPRQLALIKALLGVCPEAVNAGDFDREGQLLVDEVLELVRYPGRVLRLQTRALDRASLLRELGRMGRNEDFAGLREAARARAELDWLAGINLTRAMTLHGRGQGVRGVLSLGRVQTPTLALVVRRDEIIENFVPSPFYRLECPFEAAAGILPCELVTTPDMPGVDGEKRLTDRNEALRIRDLVSGRPGQVVLAETKRVVEAPPLPYSLTELQKEASARFRLGAQATLDICQRLYEARFVSYPRTDCRHLPEEQFAEAPAVLAAVAQFPGLSDMVAACDARRRSAAWNTARVSAHHAIIPTAEPARGLSEREGLIYTLICRRYAWQFLPPHIFHRTRVDVACEGTLWRAGGRVEESPGWTAFGGRKSPDAAEGAGRAGSGEKKEKETPLPPVRKGDPVTAGEASIVEAMTEPPARFTEGSLVDAMENIQRHMEGADADAKTVLRQTEGLGTVATRAGIIETLLARGYLEKSGKALRSTTLGRCLVHSCPRVIRDPVMTADMERSLSEIQAGRQSGPAFVAAYAATLPAVISELFAMPGDFSAMEQKQVCPLCGGALRRARDRKGTFYWVCSRAPDCAWKAADLNGQPGKPSRRGAGKAAPRQAAEGDAPACPLCGGPMVQRKGPRGPFYGCAAFPRCRGVRPLGAGTTPAASSAAVPRDPETSARTGAGVLPGVEAPDSAGSAASGVPPRAPASGGAAGETPREARAPLCPRCGGPMVARKGPKGPFYGCAAFPRCRGVRPFGEGTAPASSSAPAPGDPGIPARRGAGVLPGVPGAEPGETGAPLCPRCGRPMVARQGPKGPFYGCSAFPRCRGTRPCGERGASEGKGGRGLSASGAPAQGLHAGPSPEEVTPRYDAGPGGPPPEDLMPWNGEVDLPPDEPPPPDEMPFFEEDAPLPEEDVPFGEPRESAPREDPGEAGRRPGSPEAPLCPVCGGPMVRRKGPRGFFWGCGAFPRCRGTRQDRA